MNAQFPWANYVINHMPHTMRGWGVVVNWPKATLSEFLTHYIGDAKAYPKRSDSYRRSVFVVSWGKPDKRLHP